VSDVDRLSRPRVRREVVSFVRRSARMNPTQARAWEAFSHRYVLPVRRGETETSIDPDYRLDLAAAFGRDAPLIIEIGPGMGESLVPMAKVHAHANVLAFEVFQPAVARIVGRLASERVDNVRIIQADAVDGLSTLVSPGSVSQLWTFFPDPWHKSRHHKRRLVSPDFADLAASRLRPGGRWRLATDWADYAAQMRHVLDAHPALVSEHPGGWAPRWSARPVTRFERRGVAAGRHIFDLGYRRR
jgi:tRNA (guanine-N7-)-methyltransferase